MDPLLKALADMPPPKKKRRKAPRGKEKEAALERLEAAGWTTVVLPSKRTNYEPPSPVQAMRQLHLDRLICSGGTRVGMGELVHSGGGVKRLGSQ